MRGKFGFKKRNKRKSVWARPSLTARKRTTISVLGSRLRLSSRFAAQFTVIRISNQSFDHIRGWVSPRGWKVKEHKDLAH